MSHAPKPALQTSLVTKDVVTPRARLPIAFVATKPLDHEQVLARVVLISPSSKTRLHDKVFLNDTHARVVLEAMAPVVSYCLKSCAPMRIVVPDQTVVNLLTGEEPTKSSRLERQVATIRHKVHAQGAPVTFEFGHLDTLIGQEAIERLDLW